MLNCQKSQISRHFQYFHSKMAKFYLGKIQFSTNSPPPSNSSSIQNNKIDEITNSNSVEQTTSTKTQPAGTSGQSNVRIRASGIDPDDPFNWEPTERQRRILALIGFFKSKEDVPKQLSFRVFNRYNRRIRFLQLFFTASFFVMIVIVFHFYAEYSISKNNQGGEPLNEHFQKDIRQQIYEAAATEVAAQRRKSSGR